MKTLKVLLVALTALSFSVANAGELTITGDAKASYAIPSSDGASGVINADKGLGVSNEFTLSASGELDNGMTWSYAQDIDGATVQDDAKLTLTGGFGTVGVFIHEGGLDTDNTASQSVVSRPSDTSYNEGMVDTWDISGMNTLQYHTPAGLIPFGITAKIAHAPSLTAGVNNSFKVTGAANAVSHTSPGTGASFWNTAAAPLTQTIANMGDSATHYQVTIAEIPFIDGLTVGADYLDISGQVDVSAQEAESGSYYATYSIGPVSLGYSKSFLATGMDEHVSNNYLESLEATKMSASVNVNDELSISYENEKSEPTLKTSSTTVYDLESTGLQAAYTMGGMTLAIAMNDHENVQYSNGKDVKDTVFSVAMAF